MKTQRSLARKLWFPYRGLIQLLKLARCRLTGHRFSQWRVETEDWFKHVDEPEPYAWHSCERGCGTIERVLPPECPVCHQRYVVCDDCGPRPDGEW